MTPHLAKSIIRKELDQRGLAYTGLEAHTIDFTDLARDKGLFVRIRGWHPHLAANDLKKLASDHGFLLEFRPATGIMMVV